MAEEQNKDLVRENEKLRALVGELKQSDHAQKAVLDRLRAVVEGAYDAIISVDDRGRVDFWNRSAERVFGYSSQEMINQPFWNIVGRAQQQEIKEAFARSGLDVSVRGNTVEGQGLAKDGREFPIELSISSWTTADGVFYTAIVRDITQRQQEEEKRSLLEKQLLQAQKMEAIGSLAGGVAHDFNNLLTTINGLGDLLLSDAEIQGALREDISEIRSAGKRAASLVSQLLAFSHKQMIEPEKLSINRVVDDMDKMLRRLIGEDIELVTVLDADVGLVKVDPIQLQQITINLAINARDAMPNGGKLSINTCKLDPDHAELKKRGGGVAPHVMLRIADNGCGMDKATMSHLFEPFFTTKEQGKGTGLGLSTVYRIVQQNDGFIEVVSEPDGGTEFKIFFPCAWGDDETADIVTVAATWPRGHETVLVVEDEPTVRALIVRTLKIQGYQVLEAGNGEEGLRVAKDLGTQLDLLVTDLVMPLMGGKELSLKLLSTRPQLRVLIMSGFSDRSHLGDSSDLAFAVSMTKPFSPETLANKVRQALES